MIRKEFNYSKDLAECYDLVATLIETIKEKGDYSVVLGKLIPAIDGIGNVKADLEADRMSVSIPSIEFAEQLYVIFKK